MFDLGWSELLLIGIVALIVVGPKDLPVMFRTLGRFTGKARAMARDFQRAMNEAADEAGVKDVASDLKNATSAKKLGLDKLQDAASQFEKWQPGDAAAATEGEAKPAPRGPETAKMTEERAEQARLIRERSAQVASDRIAREKAAQEAAAAASADAGQAAPAAEGAAPTDTPDAGTKPADKTT
ncbi:Sec-independent protein translocase protein TatB [Pseudoruegeria aquimaris]|uniref:Sec-independent protein translocase protein TatB n=1 Tax=Pseudoruegeria aquimaris TaxID=393663 RepID=A0A1Y5SSW0_9RHOB|nr:Sec-independent protein translocase protein TatB [Pseudoruegeria aquimaris]SLN44389.1 Sec-independent protein translocase protein TatB [Pseudoruegeria aquimaris]